MASSTANSRGSADPPGVAGAPHGTTRAGSNYKEGRGKPRSAKSAKKRPKNAGGGRPPNAGGPPGAPRGRGRPPSKVPSSAGAPPAPADNGQPPVRSDPQGSPGGGVADPHDDGLPPVQHRVSLPTLPGGIPDSDLGPSDALIGDPKQPFEVLAPRLADSPSSLGSSYRRRLGGSSSDSSRRQDDQALRRSSASRSRRSDATRRSSSGSTLGSSIQRSDVAAMIQENRILIDERLDKDRAVMDERLEAIQNMLASLRPAPAPATAPESQTGPKIIRTVVLAVFTILA